MRQFSILLVFVVAFGGAAVLYEQESRKVKGVLSQITDLQARVGDMQAEIKRLNAELESVKLAERRRPNLNNIATRVLHNEPVKATAASTGGSVEAPSQAGNRRSLVAGDVTASAPAIRARGESGDDSAWSKPTVDAEFDAELSEVELRQSQAGNGTVADPYQ
ncbi:hypothetical protein [Microbulbifer pacificus]|uniref:hypothetical protein n=1 Tax=Microbulbifer pacificus TaxID=407164 RepID=UPI000CF54135|nr:hypothetical protein [Microbulbifer pacificus]